MGFRGSFPMGKICRMSRTEVDGGDEGGGGVEVGLKL